MIYWEHCRDNLQIAYTCSHTHARVQFKEDLARHQTGGRSSKGRESAFAGGVPGRSKQNEGIDMFCKNFKLKQR